MTHVLLPVLLLVRRADTAAVIGAALVAKAAGGGHRRIALQALVAAFAADKAIVDESSTRAAVAEVTAE